MQSRDSVKLTFRIFSSIHEKFVNVSAVVNDSNCITSLQSTVSCVNLLPIILNAVIPFVFQS